MVAKKKEEEKTDREQANEEESEEKVQEKKDNEQEENSEEAKTKRRINIGALKLPLIITVVAITAIGVGLLFSNAIKSRVKAADKGQDKKTAVQTGVFVSMGDCTVNLAGGSSYMQISVTLELDSKDKELKSQIKKKKPQIKDTIITIVSSKTDEQLLTLEGKESLKKEIKRSVQSLVKSKKIKGVYFTTFIMQ